MGRGGFQQRGGLFTSKTNNQNQGQFSGNARPLSVTVNNNFDARDTIAQKKRPVDARNKLVAKAKLSDARTKILNLKGNKGGLVNKGQTNKSSDARAMILARKNNKQMATTGNRAGVGVQSINLQRTVNQDDGNFQITRKVPGNQSGVQMSGDNVVITRTLQASQSSEFSDNPFFTKTISNQQGLGNLQPNVRGPVIQLQNEMFHAHARPQTQPMYSHAMAYDEVDDPWAQNSYPSEKTLTVKMPQSHSQFSRVPQQKFQMNKITFDSVRTVPSSPISPPTAIKRKAAGDAMSVTTGKQLRLGGVVTTTKQTRPIPQSAPQVVKRTKVLKPAPAQVVMEEEEDPTDMVLSPLQGYRILISNLHVIVTQDDIIELFGAIGPMKRARLVKPGTAEVVYVQKDDAMKAAQKYHNRELDGQSMQVKLITPAKAPVKQAPEVTTVPSQPAKEKGGPLRLGQNIKKNSPGDNVELNTLHRALFKTQANKQIKPVTFTVKI
ncbi:polymerase delta-interacting protein 3-like isoform X2 [Argopecten irradians]